MKRLLLFLNLILASTALFAQTVGIKITTPIIRNNPTDNTITGYADLLNGGYHIGLNYHSRDSLSTYYTTTLKPGMLFYSIASDSTYRWNGSTWTPVVFLNGTGFVKASGTTISYDNSTYLTTTGNGSGLTGFLSGQITTALGFTPIPYSGATGDVTLGSHNFTAATLTGTLAFTLTPGYGVSGNNFTNIANQTWTVDTSSIGGIVSKSRLATNLTGYLKVTTAAGTYVPYSSWTGNVNGGSNTLEVGTLGINTGSVTPATKLQLIETSTSTIRGALFDQVSNDALGSKVYERKSRGTPGSLLSAAANDANAHIWSYYDGTNYIDAAKFLVNAVSVATGIVPATATIQTANSAGALINGLKIDQVQNVYQGQLASVIGSITATPSGTGGAITAGNWFYKIVAGDGFGGMTLASAEGTATTTTGISSVALSWTAVPNAVVYYVFVGTSSGGENKYFIVYTNSALDTNIGGYTSASLPTINNTAIIGLVNGNLSFPGQLRQELGFTPSGYTLGTYDWQSKNITLYSAKTATQWTALSLNDANLGFTFKTNFNAGSFALITLINGAGTTSTTFLQNGTNTTVGSWLVNSGGTFGYGSIAAYTPFNSGLSYFDNNYYASPSIAGGFVWRVSNGTNGSLVEGERINYLGNHLFGTTVNGGFKMDNANTARFQQGITTGIVAAPTCSTTITPSSGTIPIGVYTYQAVAVDLNGHTTNAGPTSGAVVTVNNSTVTITITPVSGAVSYLVYFNGIKYLTAQTGTTQTDLGSSYTTSTAPTDNTTGLATIGPDGTYTIGAPVASAIMSIASTTRGVSFSSMTTTQKNAISSPIESLLVYDNTLHAYNFYNGSAWASIGGGGGLSTSNFVFNEIPTGAIDGSNTTYTLANTPSSAISVNIWYNGVKQTYVASSPTAGQYSVSGTTVTMGAAPTSGVITDSYIK